MALVFIVEDDNDIRQIEAYALKCGGFEIEEFEKNIEIRVNGALTGYGELVEVDDKLGVEIHSWLSGNNNVK